VPFSPSGSYHNCHRHPHPSPHPLLTLPSGSYATAAIDTLKESLAAQAPFTKAQAEAALRDVAAAAGVPVGALEALLGGLSTGARGLCRGAARGRQEGRDGKLSLVRAVVAAAGVSVGAVKALLGSRGTA
jgi:hypothetical protein